MRNPTNLPQRVFFLLAIVVALCKGGTAQDKVIYLDVSETEVAEQQAFYQRHIFYEGDSVRIEQFYMSGKKYFEGSVTRGSEESDSLLLVGRCRWYHKNGNVIQEKHFNAVHLLDGTMKKFTPEGNLELLAHYENGFLEDSQYEEYDSDGNATLVFREEFRKNLNDWDLYESEFGKAHLVGGKLHLESYTSRGLARYIYRPVKGRDFSFQADFEHVKKEHAPLQGMIFNFGDWDNYAYFILDGRYFSVGRMDDGVKKSSVDLFGSVAIDQEGTNTLKVHAEGNQVTYSINGSIVFREEAYELEHSNIGFVVGGEGIALVDNFEVKELNRRAGFLSDSDVQGAGTGFLIHGRGYMITNNHVVENAGDVFVEFTQGALSTFKQLRAEVVLRDANSDLALLKIVDKRFPRIDSLPYGLDVSGVGVGSSVYTLGYPYVLSGFGREVKFTDGKISSRTGFNDDIASYQTSVPVQPGSSGSPLFNEQGNIIGCMNASVREADNVSYAIKAIYINNLVQTSGLHFQPMQQQTIGTLSMEDQVRMLSQYVAIIKIR